MYTLKEMLTTVPPMVSGLNPSARGIQCLWSREVGALVGDKDYCHVTCKIFGTTVGAPTSPCPTPIERDLLVIYSC